MSPKNIIIIGTMAFVITIGGLTKDHGARAGAAFTPQETRVAHDTAKDDFLQALGAASDEEVYEALYNGKTLADIAEEHQMEVQPLIRLQVAELTKQLDSRLAAGNITTEEYQAQKSELSDIVTKSVFGGKNTDEKST